jgi:dTDP-4-amino-4,6-dideoxygalactose transaminase
MFRVNMPPEVDQAVLDVLHSGYVTQGPQVDAFEAALRKFLHTKQVVSLNSGTTALSLALRLAKVGPGDEVISTPMTCVATNVPIVTAGAKIVWADVHPITGLIDPYHVETLITPKTKAILSVDWAGLPVDYRLLDELAARNEIPFISDAAHSFGATFEGVPIGDPSLADYQAFSFQAIKLITTVDGGALAIRGTDQYKLARLLRWFGVDRDNDTPFRGELDVAEAGYKWHMNDLNAAIGLAQLPTAKASLAKQAEHAQLYDKHLSDVYQKASDYIPYPHESANWLYTILLPRPGLQAEFREFMADRGVEVTQVHWRNDRLSAFKKFKPETVLKGLDYYSTRMMCIPVHSALLEPDVEQIINAVNEFLK